MTSLQAWDISTCHNIKGACDVHDVKMYRHRHTEYTGMAAASLRGGEPGLQALLESTTVPMGIEFAVFPSFVELRAQMALAVIG